MLRCTIYGYSGPGTRIMVEFPKLKDKFTQTVVLKTPKKKVN